MCCLFLVCVAFQSAVPDQDLKRSRWYELKNPYRVSAALFDWRWLTFLALSPEESAYNMRSRGGPW